MSLPAIIKRGRLLVGTLIMEAGGRDLSYKSPHLWNSLPISDWDSDFQTPLSESESESESCLLAKYVCMVSLKQNTNVYKIQSRIQYKI